MHFPELFVCAWIFSFSSAFAATYYVAQNGDDNYNCTLGSPKATVIMRFVRSSW